MVSNHMTVQNRVPQIWGESRRAYILIYKNLIIYRKSTNKIRGSIIFAMDYKQKIKICTKPQNTMIPLVGPS